VTEHPAGWPEGRHACWYWRSDADGVATWGPTSRPVPQWTRPGVTPVETLGRQGKPPLTPARTPLAPPIRVD
jgi:hypothetical protein